MQGFKEEDKVFERTRSSGASKLKLVLKDEVELPRSRFYVKGMRKAKFQAKELKTGIVFRIERVRKAMGAR